MGTTTATKPPKKARAKTEPKRERFERFFTFDRAQLKVEDRTVPVSFSSEHPVDRGDYDEVLDHSRDGMDLTRLNDSHPLLLNHDPEKQIGVIERAELGDDKKGRAVVRFGHSDLADEIFKDVQDGIRKHMSVGYERLKVMTTTKDEKGRNTMRFAWRPYEVSIVPVPADPDVGVGRSGEPGKRNLANYDVSAVCQTALSACNNFLGVEDECATDDEAHGKAEEGARSAISALAIAIHDMDWYGDAKAHELVGTCTECAEFCVTAIKAIEGVTTCAQCVASAKEAISELTEAIEACRDHAGIEGDDAAASDGTKADEAALQTTGTDGGTVVDADTRASVDGQTLPNANAENLNTMNTPAPTPAAAAAPQPNVVEIENRARDQERTRVKNIRAAAETLIKDFPEGAQKFRTMADEAVEKGTTHDAFGHELLAAMPGVRKLVPVTAAEMGMTEQDKKRYSLVRAIQSNIKAGRAGRPDGFEGEVHDEMGKRIGSLDANGGGSGGFWVPFDMPFAAGRSDMVARRDLNVNTFGQGGAFLQTTIMTPVIEALRNRMVCQRLGVQSLGGLQGNVAIPRQTGVATAYALAESAALTVSTQAIDQIVLAPHRVGAVGKYSKQLLLQSSVDVENFLRDDLMKVLAIKWDKLILEGQGASSEPTGILNTIGIGSVTFGGAITYSKVVNFETQLSQANADLGSMAYVTTPAVREKMKITAKIGSTYPVFIWEDGYGVEGTNDGKVNSYRAAVTNQISNNAVGFGNFNDVIHALWGGYDVVVNPYTFDVNAQVQITVNTFGDVALRHAASFAWSTDAGNQ